MRPDGLNVFPEDVERALDAQEGVRESAVVGVVDGAEERVHAVLVLEPGVDPQRRHPASQRTTAGPSAHPDVFDLARFGTASNRRHEEAEAARDPRLGSIGQFDDSCSDGGYLRSAARAIRTRPSRSADRPRSMSSA